MGRGFFDRRLKIFPVSFDRAFGKLPVFFSLFVVEGASQLCFQLRGEFGRDFALDSSEYERGHLFSKELDCVFGAFDQVSFHILAATEQTGHEKPENGPKIEGRIFDWGSGESETVTGVDGQTGLSDFGFGVLDKLSFVKYGVTKSEFLKEASVPSQLSVTGNPKTTLRLVGELVFLVEHSYLEFGKPFLGLADPYGNDRGRASNQIGKVFFLVPHDQGEGLNGFPQPHLVRKQAVTAKFMQCMYMSDAISLVGSEKREPLGDSVGLGLSNR